jgi:hypothetical protein
VLTPGTEEQTQEVLTLGTEEQTQEVLTPGTEEQTQEVLTPGTEKNQWQGSFQTQSLAAGVAETTLHRVVAPHSQVGGVRKQASAH